MRAKRVAIAGEHTSISEVQPTVLDHRVKQELCDASRAFVAAEPREADDAFEGVIDATETCILTSRTTQLTIGLPVPARREMRGRHDGCRGGTPIWRPLKIRSRAGRQTGS